MTTRIDVDSLANTLRDASFSEVPEGASSGSIGQYYELVKALDGRWINTATIVDHMRRQGASEDDVKYVANKMNVVGKKSDIEVKRSGRKNFYRYNPNQAV